MAFVKGFFTGIAAAAALGVLLFAGKIYRSASINVHVTDFYFPGWMPLWFSGPDWQTPHELSIRGRSVVDGIGIPQTFADAIRVTTSLLPVSAETANGLSRLKGLECPRVSLGLSSGAGYSMERWPTG
jgi:hypothetical protein